MIQTIAGTARISTKIIKDGSVAGRDAFCQKLENRFYNNFRGCKQPKFGFIGKNINQILPTKLVMVEKLPDGDSFYNGSVSLAMEAERTIPADIVGYIVALRPYCKKEQFGGVSIEVLMHEIHHLFSYFTHPKIPNRIYKVSKLSNENNFEKFFVEHFQSPMLPHRCKDATEKLLEKEKDHKIDILQYLRYKITDEIGAYNTGESYADLYRSSRNQNPKPETDSPIQVMYLHSKLADITVMLQNALKTERNALRKKQ